MRAVLFNVLVSIQLVACVTGDNQVDDPTQEEAQADDADDFEQLPDLEIDRSALADPMDVIDQTLVDDSPRAPADKDLPSFEAALRALLRR